MNSYLKEMKCQSCGEAYSEKIMQTLCLNSNCRSSLFRSYEQKTSMQDEIFVANVYNMWRYKGFHPLLTTKIIFAMGKSFIPFTCIDDAIFEGNGYCKFWKLNTCNQIITGTSMERRLARLMKNSMMLLLIL